MEENYPTPPAAAPRREDNKYIIPLSILAAGALIAGSIYFSKSGVQPTPGVPTAAEEVAITPVDRTDHIRGNPDAPIILVEYSDTDCPFCQRFHGTAQRLIDEYGKDGSLAWVYRHYPIPQLHPGAPREAEALECVAELGGEGKFWEYADALYKNPRTETNQGHPELSVLAANLGVDQAAFTECLDSGRMKEVVDAEATNAELSGGQGTPHNVLVFKDEVSDEVRAVVTELQAQLPPQTIVISEDEMRIRIGGALPDDMMKALIDAGLQG